MKVTQELDLNELLKKRRQIAAIWSIEDVQEIRPELTDDQAWEVLQEVDRNQDAQFGIAWTTLEWAADELFPESPRTSEEKP